MPMVDTSYLIGGFYDPPHPSVNPLAQQAEDEAVIWLRQTGFVTTAAQEEHLRSFKFGLYHGLATPHVDLPHLLIGLKWFCWGSLADDQYDNYEGGEREERLMRAISEIEAVISGVEIADRPANAIIVGFAEFWPELTAGLSQQRRRQVAGHFMDYLHAVAVQINFQAHGRIPDIATFLGMRRNTIAMIFQADVLEIVSQIPVPDKLRDSLAFRELVSCFADITAWHNDVYGLEKDIADGQTCNMVRVVAASEGCLLHDAVTRVLHRAMERQRVFLEIQESLPLVADRLGLPAEAGESAVRLAQDLRAYTYANLVWARETRRYDLDRPRLRGTFNDVITA